MFNKKNNEEMSTFKLHTLETAPEKSKPLIEGSIKANGVLPGLHAILSESPQLFEAYNTLHGLFTSSSFDKEELTVVWQTINVEHSCHYCVPAHTAIAGMMKVDEAITTALRNETALPTAKLEALRNMTLAIVRGRGIVSETETEAFYAAGYENRQILDIILGLAQKTISNYTNHFAKTPVDEMFQPFVWEKATV